MHLLCRMQETLRLVRLIQHGCHGHLAEHGRPLSRLSSSKRFASASLVMVTVHLLQCCLLVSCPWASSTPVTEDKADAVPDTNRDSAIVTNCKCDS